MLVFALLKMNRIDMAKELLVKMKMVQDDATSTMVSLITVNIVDAVHMGSVSLQETLYILEEIVDGYGSSPLLESLRIILLYLQGQSEKAFLHLQQNKVNKRLPRDVDVYFYNRLKT